MKKENKDISTYIPKELVLLLGIIVAIITISLGIKISLTGLSLDISYIFIPILLGIVMEQRFLGFKWKEIMIKSFIAYCIFIAFFLFYVDKENMFFDRNFTTLLFAVLIISYMSISIGYSYYIKESEKLVSKLTEGVLLLQTLSIIYLVLDYSFLDNLNLIKIIVLSILLGFSIYTLYHSFSTKLPTEKTKLLLSIGSSIITIAFSILYFFKISKLDITEYNDLDSNTIIFLQYLLFGMSIIYFTQNIWLLIRFIPDKGERKNEYKSRIKKLKKEHVSRFLDVQISKTEALLCITIIGSIYYLNFIYNWVYNLTLIWFVFTLFPVLMFYYQKVTQLKKKK